MANLSTKQLWSRKWEVPDSGRIIPSNSEKNQRSQWHKSWSPKARESELCCLRVRIYGLPSSKKEERPHPLTAPVFPQATQKIGWCPPTFVWVACLSESNADLFQKQPTKTLRNDVLPAIWESFSPVKLTHNITHHTQWSMDDFSMTNWDVDQWRLKEGRIPESFPSAM